MFLLEHFNDFNLNMWNVKSYENLERLSLSNLKQWEIRHHLAVLVLLVLLKQDKPQTNKRNKTDENVPGISSQCPFDCLISDQSYKAPTIINYDSGVVIWGIFKSGTTLES